MAEKILNTRIVLRNDSSANWLANNNQVLLKGEVGIEFLANDKIKMKVGDGTKTWEQLSYFGGEFAHVIEPEVVTAGANHITAIEAAAINIDLAVGDIAIVRENIFGDNIIHAAYVYNGTEWKSINGGIKSVFTTEEALNAYLVDPAAYPGQIVALVSNSKTIIYYLDYNHEAETEEEKS